PTSSLTGTSKESAPTVLFDDLEVRHARRRLPPSRIRGHEYQAISSGRQIFHHYHHADRNYRTSLLQKIVRRNGPGEEHFLVGGALLNLVAEDDTRRFFRG